MAEPLFESSFLRKLDRLSLITRRAMAGDMQGERRSPRRGSSVEFADYRPYGIGDDIRQIDWNLYARAERFFLKLFVAEEELSVHLLLDTSASMDWGEPNKFLYAQRLVAAFGYIVLTSLDRVSVSAFGSGNQQLPSVRGKRGAVPLFRFLQDMKAGGSLDLETRCRRYVQTVRTPGPIVLCSDLLDPNWQEALRALSSRAMDITLLHVLAPQELEPEIDGDFRLLDAEGGAAIEVTADLDLMRRYQEQLQAWRDEVERFCNGRGITYLFADSSVPIEEFVLTNMRRRGVLR